jgi:hypothetical protein
MYEVFNWQNVDRKDRIAKIKEDYKELFGNPGVTVPGQAVSIKQIMDRYEKGRPVPVE